MGTAWSDQVILITGATGGIGSAIARSLGGKKARMILAGRNPEKLDALSRELGAPALAADVTQEDQVESLMTRVLSAHGRLTGIIHAVGSILLKPAHQTTLEEFRATVDTNLTSAFLMLKHGVRPMFGTGGSVVLFSTVAAGIGLSNHEAITAAKAGVEGLVAAAAATYANRGIRVNAVAPGLTRTPLSERLTSNPAILKASEAMHPLGRIGEPEDIASAALWLADPRNNWVTGQVLRVDGGLSSIRPR